MYINCSPITSNLPLMTLRLSLSSGNRSIMNCIIDSFSFVLNYTFIRLQYCSLVKIFCLCLTHMNVSTVITSISASIQEAKQ